MIKNRTLAVDETGTILPKEVRKEERQGRRDEKNFNATSCSVMYKFLTQKKNKVYNCDFCDWFAVSGTFLVLDPSHVSSVENILVPSV